MKIWGISRGFRRRLFVYGLLGLCLAVPLMLNRWRPWEPSQIVWSMKTGGEFLAGPAVGEARIYFASNDRTLHAMDWPSREMIWATLLPDQPADAPLLDAEEGLLFVVTQGGFILAHDAETGDRLWGRRVITARHRASPVCDDDTLYVGMPDAQVYAMEKTTGRLRWQVFAGGPIRTGPALVDGTVYVATELGLVLALDAETGAERWAFQTEGRIHGSPAVNEGVVYIGSQDMHLYAIDAETGELIWRRRAWHEISSRPAFADGCVIYGSWDYHVTCADIRDGHIIWRHGTQDVVEGSPLVADGVVYIGSRDGAVYALDLETGRQIWREQTGTWVTATPALAPGGDAILAASQDATLYALSP
ncbi:PQQ-like beta-propeller repeat protein [Candidatus Sumerlaeota bacterium]|nr:PQQ-like beta-propeller repeat protein [Candidatus Sumerlaeota bacterium]